MTREKELAVLNAAHRYYLAVHAHAKSEHATKDAIAKWDSPLDVYRSEAIAQSDKGSVFHAAADILEAVEAWGREAAE